MLIYDVRDENGPRGVIIVVERRKMLRCKACAVPVPKSQERRLLESSQSEQVRSTLEVSFTDHGCCEAAARQHVSSGYVCKKCFVLMEKKVRLELELEKVKSDLGRKVVGAIHSFSLPEEPRSIGVLEAPTISSAVTRKRPSAAAPSAPKRPRIDEEHSPSVSVSYLCYKTWGWLGGLLFLILNCR